MAKSVFDNIFALINRMVNFLPFFRLGIFRQIAIITEVMVLLILFLGVFGYLELDQSHSALEQKYNENMNQLNDMTQMEISINDIVRNYLSRLSQTSSVETTGYNDAFFADLKKSALLASKILKENDRTSFNQAVESIRTVSQSAPNIAGFQRLLKLETQIDTSLSKVKSGLKSSSSFDRILANSKQNLIIDILIFFSAAAIIGIAFAFFVSRPLKKAASAVLSLAEGDLNQTIDEANCVEISGVADGLNHAIMTLRNLIKRVNQESGHLSSTIQKMNQTSNETAGSIVEVVAATNDLALSAQKQSDHINQAIQTIQILTDLVQGFSAETGRITSGSQKVSETAKLGQEASERMAGEINEIFHSSADLKIITDEINKTLDEISQVASVIQSVSRQTSLLALNASIEASRAGEYGKGFQVVAKETVKLAEQSQKAAAGIDELIVKMRSRTHDSLDAIEKGIARVTVGHELIEKTQHTFSDIFNALNDNLEQIDRVGQSILQMSDRKDEIISAMGTIAGFARETAMGTEKISTTTSKQNALVRQLIDLANDLTLISHNLRDSIDYFEIKEHQRV